MSKPKTITVRARDSAKPCPTENRSRVRLYEHKAATETEPAEIRDRHCIYRDEPREVPNSRYYRRRIIRKDLELVETGKRKAPTRPPRTPTKNSGDNR